MFFDKGNWGRSIEQNEKMELFYSTVIVTIVCALVCNLAENPKPRTENTKILVLGFQAKKQYTAIASLNM